VLRLSMVYHDPQHYVFPRWDEEAQRVDPAPFDPAKQNVGWLQDNVNAGLEVMQYLGVGGMNTRGFGRLRIVNLPQQTARGGK
jgi:hypothetical protein